MPRTKTARVFVKVKRSVSGSAKSSFGRLLYVRRRCGSLHKNIKLNPLKIKGIIGVLI